MRHSLRNVCVCVASGCAACALLLGISSCQTSQALFASAGALGVLTDNTLLTAVGTSGASIARAAEPISAEQEYYIGRAVAATLLESYQLYENAELTEYVNSVCQTLALNSERPELFNGYYAAVLDTDQINAFATSGGHILITRGLLDCTDSEDSLAAVLAHEIAHIQLQHSIKAIKTARTSDAVLTTAAGVLAVGTEQEAAALLDTSVNEIITTMVNKGYSKSQEYDADETALSIMASAGYDPVKMTNMLRLLEERQPGSSGGFGTTHPSAKSRLEKVEKALKKYEAPAVPPVRQQRFDAVMSQVNL